MIKRGDSGASNDVTIDADGSEEIDGDPSYSLTAEYQYVAIVSNGTG